MAGVSAACITPPWVLDITRFSQEDRTAALVNYVLGFTHIMEGAIPFAAKNLIADIVKKAAASYLF